MSEPKLLFWDTENSPIIACVWGLYDQNIGHEAILEDWKFICASWVWNDSGKIESIRWEKTNDKELSPILGYSDEKIVRKLHAVLSEADILVAQNGDEHDLKKFNARAIYYGLSPIPEKPSVDTLKIARKWFKFTSNKLDYIGRYLNIGGKLPTDIKLWIKVMFGCKKSLDYMVKYCGVDVLKVRKYYRKLLPWITNHPNRNLFRDDSGKLKCSNCKDGNVQKRGYRYTRVGKKQTYQCTSCGGWMTDNKTITTAKIR